MLAQETRRIRNKSEGKEMRKFETEYGYFTSDGMEYVITRPDTPRPWVNVIANGDYGMIVSQTGSGFSWHKNSNLSRITRWEQDLIKDEWGKYIYLLDRDEEEFWSLTWKPCMPSYDFYEVRHGLGYSVLKSAYRGFECEILIFVDREDPVEIWSLRLKNVSGRRKRVALFSYFEWCLGNAADTHREFQKTFIEADIDPERHAIVAKKRPAVVPGFISTGLGETPLTAFHGVSLKPAAYECDKEAFFGRYGNLLAPRGVREGKLTNSQGKWIDAVASLQVDLGLDDGEEKTVVFTVGAVSDRSRIGEIQRKYSHPGALERELERVREFWRGVRESSWIDTPDEAMNFMTNIWLKYQAISGRLWARCGYYQSSGAFGFRDQLQDAHIYLPMKPEWTKRQILLHAEAQYSDGSVLHWWHPGTHIGMRTQISDDLLWLVFVTLSYLNETADTGILDEEANFLPDAKGKVERANLYEHCVRAIERVLSRFSPRGLPLMGEGDWNDGLSHVGVREKGESVWLAHFLYGLLRDFSPWVVKRDPRRARRYLQRAKALKQAINRYAWDGDWYSRATRDDGRPLGDKASREGKIFLNAQTWAIINETAPPDRAKRCMASAEKYLFRKYGPLLLTPSFSVTDATVGYITRYAPSIRENGGLYTHAGTWAIQAECKLGEGDKAYQLYRSFCPILRGLDPELYYVEPYVSAGNVDGLDSPYFGRGGWTWYTGSAAWLYRVAWEGIIGVQPRPEGLHLWPVIPRTWKSLKVRRVFRDATYEITIRNPKGVSSGVREVRVDGEKLRGNLIPPHQDGRVHQVGVILG